MLSYYRKDYAKAYRHLTAYLKRSPRDRGAQKLLGSLALSTGDSAYALHLLERLTPKSLDDIEVQTLFGDALIRAKRYTDAVDMLEDMVKSIYPDSSKCRILNHSNRIIIRFCLSVQMMNIARFVLRV